MNGRCFSCYGHPVIYIECHLTIKLDHKRPFENPSDYKSKFLIRLDRGACLQEMLLVGG